MTKRKTTFVGFEAGIQKKAFAESTMTHAGHRDGRIAKLDLPANDITDKYAAQPDG